MYGTLPHTGFGALITTAIGVTAMAVGWILRKVGRK